MLTRRWTSTSNPEGVNLDHLEGGFSLANRESKCYSVSKMKPLVASPKSKSLPKSAVSKMITNIPTAHPWETILDIKNRIQKKINELETINYIYVLDKKEKLVGVLSIKEIFRKPESLKVKDLMERKLVSAKPHTDQEKIALLALRHNLKSIPLVDKEGKFLGIVPSDAILAILHQENIEDLLRLGGIRHEANLPTQTLTASTQTLVKARLPWLLLGLLGGILAAQITTFFEIPLKEHFILAAFIPLIIYMADATGTQTETLFIRGLAIDRKLDIKKYLWREIKIGFFLALTCGLFLLLLSTLRYRLLYTSFVIGFSLFLTSLVAILVAIFIPWLLAKYKKDPAIGAGPFATIISDVVSLALYLLVASLMLGL